MVCCDRAPPLYRANTRLARQFHLSGLLAQKKERNQHFVKERKKERKKERRKKSAFCKRKKERKKKERNQNFVKERKKERKKATKNKDERKY